MDMTMSMTMATSTTDASAAATTTAMSGMGSMGAGGMSCEISMLWNWNTVGACFISSQWQITSAGMFAGSCIGVILLVMSLELLRRGVKEYDRFIIRKHQEVHSTHQEAGAPHTVAAIPAGHDDCREPDNKRGPLSSPTFDEGGNSGSLPPFRPSILQQAVRALLHMLQFAVAYFVMLLAMYYNGYFIICIFIGAYLGSFVFHWETLSHGASLRTTAAKEATVCCG
ncbi:hypothetical protein NKR23_g3854 [Pleurostoma richardsiae]|uniref:Copper transport protein n=1 Tax=Pleurostoma richardsiae TaxID=41990 RepID=A0AA38RIK2_9PEZI|nr:hypothetical protein NKR23_g3854 [Pleurostoma richardsiae]